MARRFERFPASDKFDEPVLPSDRSRSNTVTTLNVLSGILLLVAFILFLIYTVTPQLKGKEKVLTGTDPTVIVDCLNPYTEANSTVCNKTSDCLQGFFVAPDNATCHYLARPNSVVDCTSPCCTGRGSYCDGAGKCTCSARSCVANCFANSECNDIPMENDVTIFYADPVTTWPWTGVFGENGICFYGMCIQVYVDLYVASTIYPIYVSPSIQKAVTPLAAAIFCRDYIDDSYYQAHKECLVFERHLLDTTINNYSNLNLNFAGTNDVNASYPLQMSVCLIWFSCGQTYRATSPTPTPGKRRSLIAHTAHEEAALEGEKPPQAWGFHPHPHHEETPKPGPVMNIPYPEQRQALWSHLHHTIKNDMGPKLLEMLDYKLSKEGFAGKMKHGEVLAGMIV